MLLLGIDIGTSSVKVSVMDAETGDLVASAFYPETEAPLNAPQQGWAEQNPEDWFSYFKSAFRLALKRHPFDSGAIVSVGISYQMHGLVLLDERDHLLRPAILWCDSRAVEIGRRAFEDLGASFCLQHLLNSPGNFTAAKLSWVREHEPELFAKVRSVLLPGEYVAFRLTGRKFSSISGRSEGIFWDFKERKESLNLMNYFGIERSWLPPMEDVFTTHGHLLPEIAGDLGIPSTAVVSYLAGDQPNNALSLGVMHPGEVAATAGTSGVIYAISKELVSDRNSRVNAFAHVNYTVDQPSLGIMLCINATGILNSWMRQLVAPGTAYFELDQLASEIPPGSEGLSLIPFGNGAERIFSNRSPKAHLMGIDLTRHRKAHLLRAAQEGIAFSFRYGLDILRENGINPSIIRAGKANMFRSSVFVDAFVNTCGIPVELYENDGSLGAAIGSGLGCGLYHSESDAFNRIKKAGVITPDGHRQYDEAYGRWLDQLKAVLSVGK